MKLLDTTLCVSLLLTCALLPATASGQRAATTQSPYSGWAHSGAATILTTPEGADLPASVSVENFPLLLRLTRASFDFKQARPEGEDLRVSTAEGKPLAYQIEAWDAAQGKATVWIRVPRITGSVAGVVVTLRLRGPSTARSITYLKEMSWSQKRLLTGKNKMAALTFCNLPVDPPN